MFKSLNSSFLKQALTFQFSTLLIGLGLIGLGSTASFAMQGDPNPPPKAKATELTDQEIHSLLKDARDFRHKIKGPKDPKVADAKFNYRHVIFGTKNKNYLNQAFLGLAKIENVLGNHEAALHYAESSLKEVDLQDLNEEADPRDLETLAWLIDYPEIQRARSASHAQRILRINPVQIPSEQRRFYLKTVAQAHLILGNLTSIRIENFKKALSYAQELQDLRLQAQAWIGLGKNWQDQPGSFSQALQLAHSANDPTLEAMAHIGLGNAHVDSEMHYLEALRISDPERKDSPSKEDYRIQSEAWIGLGNLQKDLSKFRAGLYYADRIEDQRLRVRALIGMARSSRDLNCADHYYKWAIQEANGNPDLTVKAQKAYSTRFRFFANF